MFDKLLRNRHGKIIRVIELEHQRVSLPYLAIRVQLFRVVHGWDHCGIRISAEHVLTKYKMAQGQWQARCLFDSHAARDVTGAGIILRL